MKDAMRLLCKLCLLAAFFVLAPPELMAQTTAKGQVFDSTGETVIGATVMEKGNSKNAVATDFDGNFTLKVPAGKKIVVTYMGMKTQELAPSANMRITMEDDNAALEEVVVVGYVSKARKDLTGSVGSIQGKKLEAVPVSSASEALQGKIAGVQVTTVDGQPGADINIRVRGATSVTQSNEPLYIVDGFQQSNINDIPPSDIASIDVLKDASLTAIYGAKGGNGVIVVTTKSAQAGKVQVEFNGRLTVAHRAKKLDVMNIADFAEYTWDRAQGGVSYSSTTARNWREHFGNPADLDVYTTVPNMDWQDEVMNESPMNYMANVAIGGGSDNTRFKLSVTQTDDKGTIKGSGVRRTNINLKLSTNLSKNLKFNYSPTMTYRRDNGAGGEGVGTAGIIDVLKYAPTKGYTQFGTYGTHFTLVDPDALAEWDENNPISNIATNVQKKHSYNVNNRMSLTWTPIEGLTLRTEGNFSITFSDQQRYWGYLTSEGKKYNSQPVAQVVKRTAQSYTWTNTATYDMTIQDDHNLSFLLGQEIYNTEYKTSTQKNRYFDRTITAERAFDNMGLGDVYLSETYRSTPDRTASFFGQVSYNWKHRYLASATLRADGSTKFAPGNQWGWFPSISGAWVISDEPFMKNVKWVDNLKLRVAFGLAGNNQIDSDLWRYRYTVSTEGGPGFGEQRQYGEMYYSSPSQYPNKDVKWETTVTRNLAFDISLFKGRLTVTPEVYVNTTRDLLYKSPISTTSGYTTQQQNIGKVQNSGFELTVNGDIVRGKDYVVSANLTLGHNKMKVKALNASDDVLYNNSTRFYSSGKDDYILQVGGEVGLFYGYVYDGLYSIDDFDIDTWNNKTKWVLKDGVPEMTTDVQAASTSGDPSMPGKIKFKDLDGDGKITDKDRTVIGNTNPRWQGGFGLSGQWKDFDFTANFTYMLDFDVYNGTAYALSSSSSKGTEYTNVLKEFGRGNRWIYTADFGSHDDYTTTAKTVLDQTTDYLDINRPKGRWNPADVVTNTINSYFVEDGSFLRCSDVTVGYTLPKNLAKKLYLSKLRVYGSLGNLFILTGYSGYDPEVDVQSGLTPSMDYNRYPRARTFSFGINATF
ncbi:MAG: TonB-dependent receptor [Prevotella sp.]|nr:TonB-dependent receptor [Prevotella sp.]